MKAIKANGRRFLVLILVGIGAVTGCRSDGAKAGSNIGDFICFQYVGDSDRWGPPLAVCVCNPSSELKERIGKYLYDPSFEQDWLQLIKISPDDFKEFEIPISESISNALGQSMGWGDMRVTIVFGSKVQSKAIGGDDYELLVNKIPVDVWQRNPELAADIKAVERYPPPPTRHTNQSGTDANEK